MAIALVGNLVPPLVSVFSGPILAQALGVGGRGMVAAATAPFALVVALVTFGVPEAVTYTVARQPHLARNVLRRGGWLLLAAGVVASALVFVSSTVLSGEDAEIRHLMLIAAAAIVPNLIVGALRGVASATGRWTLVTTQRILGAVLKLVLLIPFWLTGNLTPVVATIIIAAVPVLGAFPYVLMLRELPPRSLDVPADARTPALLSYGSRSWAGSVSGILHARVDQVLLTPLAGPVEMGLYVVAVAVGELPLIVHASIRDVNFVSEASGSQDSRLATTARISGLLTGGAAVVVGATMFWWLPLLYGAEFEDALPAAVVMLAAVVLGTPGSIAGSGLSGRGRPGLRSMTLFAAFAVNVALLFALVPSMGAVGAAWATVGGQVTQGAACIYLVNRHYGIPMRAFLGVRRSDVGEVARLLAAVARKLVPSRLASGRKG
jgi:O-antigen/teichoic acid export membrane protein